MSSTSSSPPTQTSPGGDINDNFFTPGSSPPLILAFLAIGLFSAAMVAVFGWRRVHTGRALARYGMMDPLGRHMGDGAGTGNGRKKVVDYGEPPKLWDLWTGSPRDGIRSGSQLRGVEEDLGLGVGNDTDIEVEKKNGKNWGFAMDDRGEEVRWDNLMPLAVTSINGSNPTSNNNDSTTNDTQDRHSPNNAPTNSPSLFLSFRPHLASFRRNLTALRAHLPTRSRNQNPSPSPGSPPDDSRPTVNTNTQDPHLLNPNSEKPYIPSSSSPSTSSAPSSQIMQIAIAIAMPTPPKSKLSKRTSVKSVLSDDEEDNRLEYALGFCQVPCHDHGVGGREMG